MKRLSIPDGDLLGRVDRGDEDALRELYERHSAVIYRFSLQMSGSRAVAEEIVQEVFLAFLRGARPQQVGENGMSSWFLGMARNFVLRLLERDRRYLSLGSPDEGDGIEPPTDGPTQFEALVRAEALEDLRRAILKLPTRYREVVVLCCLQEKSYEEAAAILDCSEGTVRSRLHRGRAFLTAKLRPNARCSA
jgi:RNA polymerase sigma-70 factor (ECF subfamily)